jgi:hypothetical protein
MPRGLSAILGATMLLLACSTGPVGDDDVVVDDDCTPADDDSGDDDTPVDDDVADDDSAAAGDADGDGWSASAGDCDDADASIHPGADETLCDGVDSDCDGSGEAVVAVVDGMEFQSLASATTATTQGSVVEICPGTYTEQLYFNQTCDFTLTSFSGDPADTILDGLGTHTALYLPTEATVTVSHLTMRNGLGEPWLAGGHAGGGIMSFAAGLTLVDCVFSGNGVTGAAGVGGAVAFYRYSTGSGPSSLRVEDCRFEDNSAQPKKGGYGGAIWANTYNDESLTVEIVGSSFTGNSAGHNGGAISTQGQETAPAHTTVSDSTFEGNSVETGDGGALLVDDWATVDITNCIFTGSSAGNDGGAVNLRHPTVVPAFVSVSDSTFDSNLTGHSGGALAVVAGPDTAIDLCLDTVTFAGNAAVHDAGAVEIDYDGDYQVMLTDVDFTANTSQHFGGGLAVASDGTVRLQMDGGSFTGNQAEGGGGAIHTYSTPYAPAALDLTLTGVLIDGNTVVSSDRGVIWMPYTETVTLDGCTVTSNTGGGATLLNNADVTLISLDTDWGTGATDNTPFDVGIENGPAYDTYGANATFTCTGDLGCQ